ncbi:transglycosylase family protein [Streptacidiphilus sp. N1-3]|uniref:Transglycosylase family protein n=1 Tax=Streptacidiphilus alkalitolerans TaxID=3342712 RepID=A0ABV6WVT0_9ACTN
MIFRHENDAVRNADNTAAIEGGRKKSRRIRAAVIAGVVVAAPVAGLLTATGASAASGSTWDAVAQCESGGNWSIDTGNGYSGGLQFSPSTWSAYGGDQYAASASQASESQQIAVAEQVLASQGPGAWPVCGPQAGLSQGDAGSSSTSDSAAGSSSNSASSDSTSASTGNSDDSASAAAAPSSNVDNSASSAQATGATYTVKSGDTLGTIAAANGESWQTLYAANTSTVGANPDLIFPGQVLSIG